MTGAGGRARPAGRALGGHLVEAAWGTRAQRPVLAERQLVARDPAVDVGAGDGEHALGAGLAAGLQHVERAEGVGEEGLAGVGPAAADVGRPARW